MKLLGNMIRALSVPTYKTVLIDWPSCERDQQKLLYFYGKKSHTKYKAPIAMVEGH